MISSHLRRSRCLNRTYRRVTVFLSKPLNQFFGALFLAIALAGCGAQTVSLSGAGVTPPVPAITVTPGALAFGNVDLGVATSQSVSVNSTGTANLLVSAITISGPEFALTTKPVLPLTLAPGTSSALTVAFDPTVVGSAVGALAITSNATTSPVATVAITGTVTTQGYTVGLTWTPPAAGNDPVIAYNVYRGAHGSGIYVAIATNVTSAAYTDTTVVAGQTYDYVVKSVDGSGNLSLPSNVYTAVIP